MNYSMALFLINNRARAIVCSYRPKEEAKKRSSGELNFSTHKTLDPTIKVGDLVVVPTGTRHGMTVVKVEEVDIEVDFESDENVRWIVCRVDPRTYDQHSANEAQAISHMKQLERRKRRAQLRDDLMDGYQDEIKALPIANFNGDEPSTPQNE